MTTSPNPASDISSIRTSTTTATSISTAMATSPPLSPVSATTTTASTNITANSTTGAVPSFSSSTTATTTATSAGTGAGAGGFVFPATYGFPPFFTVQPNAATRHSQLRKWSALIQAWCRHHRLFRLSVVDAVNSPLFHNTALRKRVSLSEARAIIDWMAKSEEEGGGGKRAEWVPVGTPGASNFASAAGLEGVSSLMSGITGGTVVVSTAKTVAWIWWRRPEEWATLIVDWVEETGQKNTVLTLYELMHGEVTESQEFHAMDPEVMLKSLNVLVKRGKAQVFGNEDQQGVKFF